MCELCNRNPQKKNCQQEIFKENIDKGLVMMRLEGRSKKVAETVWCNPVGKNLLRVESMPFFTNVCSYGDTVEAKQTNSHEWLYTFDKTIERITVGSYAIFNVSNMSKTEMWIKHNLFVELCEEHQLHTECPMPGYAIIAIPYGQTEKYKQIILENVDTAGLQLAM